MRFRKNVLLRDGDRTILPQFASMLMVRNIAAKAGVLFTAAALGAWLTVWRRRRKSVNDPAFVSAYLDDDEAADMIRRFLPALERARILATAR